MSNDRPEVWLRGPIAGVPDLLQPVAHALIQVREELPGWLAGFPDSLLGERPAGAASVAFHLQHISGVVDRLCTYARGEQLSHEQLEALRREGTAAGGGWTVDGLVGEVSSAMDRALEQLRATDAATLADAREVGRARLPSTVGGLLFHAAEHAQRHLGQLIVTARVLRPRPQS